MDEQSDVVVVVNPVAGRGRAASIAEQAVVRLAARRVDHRLESPADPTAASVLLTSLAGSGTRTIVVGGDGMVHLAVNAFAGTSTPLGVVAGGTGNDFAAALGLPSRTADAVDAALADTAPVDLLRVEGQGEGRYVATVATLGFSAVVNERAERMSFPKGSSRYMVATLLELVRLEPYDVLITVDGATTAESVALVAVANTCLFGGGMKIAPDARPDDGLAEVLIIGAVPRRTLLRVLPKAFSGGHLEHPAVKVLRGADISITSSASALSVRGDGEPVTSTAATLITVPGAIAVAGVQHGNEETGG